MRFITDIQAKACVKSQSDKMSILGFIKAVLDVNTWIVLIFRVSTFFVFIKCYPISKLFWFINRLLFTVDLDPRANLAGGLMLVHGMCIVIGHEVKSKGILKIYQGATIGGNHGKRKVIDGFSTGQPVLCNNVIIGINSCVLGPIIVGENSVVGTGAIATKDVLENVTVVSVNKVIPTI